MKGQLSVEHLVIVGLSLMVIVPATFLLVKYSESTADQANSERIKDLGDLLVYNGRDIYFKGPGNLISLGLVIPQVVENISLEGGSELVVGYRTLQGPSQAVFFLDYPAVGPNDLPSELIIDRSGIANFVMNTTETGDVKFFVR